MTSVFNQSSRTELNEVQLKQTINKQKGFLMQLTLLSQK